MSTYTGTKLFANRELFYTDSPFETTGEVQENNVGDVNYIDGITSDPSCVGAPVYIARLLYEVSGGTKFGTVVNNSITVYAAASSNGDVDQGMILYLDSAGTNPFDGQNIWHFINATDYQDPLGDYIKVNNEGRITDITQ